MQEELKLICQNALTKSFECLKECTNEKQYIQLITPVLLPSTRPKVHFQLNNAMQIPKILKQITDDKAKEIQQQITNPAQAAQFIIKNIESQSDYQFQAVGPFINIAISAEKLFKYAFENYIPQKVNDLPTHPQYDEYKRIAVDLSSPNIAKDMHVGHICSTIIGDFVCRLFEFLQDKSSSNKIDTVPTQMVDGLTVEEEAHMQDFMNNLPYQDESLPAVFRINHIGDWGTQFGMLISYFQTKEGTELSIHEVEQDISKFDVSSLQDFYKKARVLFDSNEQFKKMSQEAVVRLQHGDEQELKIWKQIVSISRRAFNQIYKQLDIKLVEQGESFYNDKLQTAVDDAENAKLITIADNGAKVILFDNKKIPTLIVRKADGGYGYDSTDLACIKYRLQQLKCDRLIYVTDLGQETHFTSIFTTARNIGYLKNQEAQHCGFGVVCGADGKRMKTRSGETLKLADLLEEGYQRSLKIVQEANSIKDKEEQEIVARKISISAIKYSFLTANRQKDIKFDFDKILSFKGNTACYMLYSYARINSIAKKIVEKNPEINLEEILSKEVPSDYKFSDEERQLLYTLSKKDTLLLQLTNTLQPYQLCEWMYQISTDFTGFYEKCRVINQDGSIDSTRLQICEMVRKALMLSFKLLGLQEVERM